MTLGESSFIAPNEGGSIEQKANSEAWVGANCMCLMIIQKSMLDAIHEI